MVNAAGSRPMACIEAKKSPVMNSGGRRTRRSLRRSSTTKTEAGRIRSESFQLGFRARIPIKGQMGCALESRMLAQDGANLETFEWLKNLDVGKRR
jgi:hypothetical protein